MTPLPLSASSLRLALICPCSIRLSIFAPGLVLRLKMPKAQARRKPTRIGRSGAYLKPLLIQVALAASRSEKHPEIYGKKQALQKRRGKKKAIIAIARRLLTAIYHILKKGEPYNPAAYIKEDNPPVVRQISQEKAFEMLARMGYSVLEYAPPPPLPA